MLFSLKKVNFKFNTGKKDERDGKRVKRAPAGLWSAKALLLLFRFVSPRLCLWDSHVLAMLSHPLVYDIVDLAVHYCRRVARRASSCFFFFK